MDAKICDKCGKTFKEINQVAEITAIDEGGVMITGKTVEGRKPGIHITMKTITQSPYLKKHYDLCPECAEKIIDFLSSGTYPWKEEKTDCIYCGNCDHTFCAKFDSKEEE